MSEDELRQLKALLGKLRDDMRIVGSNKVAYGTEINVVDNLVSVLIDGGAS